MATVCISNLCLGNHRNGHYCFPLFYQSCTCTGNTHSSFVCQVATNNHNIPQFCFAGLVRRKKNCVVFWWEYSLLWSKAFHLFSGSFSIFNLLLLWLPYSTVLLLLQWLRRKSYLKPLRWINSWKPFFDAYFGQLKPKHHYWVRLLLLVRIFLLVLFAARAAITPKVNIVAIIILPLILLLYQVYSGIVYKTLYLSLLENSFIVHLALLGVATIYVHEHCEQAYLKTVIYMSIGIVFVKFWVIALYHMYIWSRIRYTYVT